MGRQVTFILNDRWDAPQTLGFPKLGSEANAVADDKYSRHHIAGRKYMQMLSFLLEEFEFITIVDKKVRAADQNLTSCDKRVRKLAEYEQGNAAHPLRAALFWAPINLFVGPMADYRTFDPGSGVEQVKPLLFPQERWHAVKKIPVTLEDCGVNLKNLTACENGETLRFKMKVDDAEVKGKLSDLLDNMHEAAGKSHMQPWRFDPDEWAIVDTSKDRNKILEVTTVQAAATQYTQAINGNLVVLSKTWADVANQTPPIKFKMILKTNA